MKKTLAALTAFFYLYGFTFCLCNAAAMGEVHSEVSTAIAAHAPAQSGDEQGEACAHHDQENEQGQSHHGQSTTDTCCLTFLQNTPGLLPDLSDKPLFPSYSSLHFLPVSTFHLDTWQNVSLFRNHGPPGLVLQDPRLSLLSPRAPPLPA